MLTVAVMRFALTGAVIVETIHNSAIGCVVGDHLRGFQKHPPVEEGHYTKDIWI